MIIAALTLALAGCGTKDGASSGSSSSEDGGDGKRSIK